MGCENMEVLDIVLIVPGLIFLAYGLWGLKKGKIGPPLLFAALMRKEWGFAYGKDEEGYYASIFFYFFFAFVWFIILIAYFYYKYVH